MSGFSYEDYKKELRLRAYEEEQKRKQEQGENSFSYKQYKKLYDKGLINFPEGDLPEEFTKNTPSLSAETPSVPAASSSSPKLDYGTKKDLETLDFEKKYDGYSLANLSSAYADTDNKDEQAWIENKIQQSNSREDIQKLVDALHKSGESDAQRMKEGYVYDGYNQTAGERLAHMSARYQNQISMLGRVGNRIKRGQSANDADKEAEKKYGGMSVSELMDAYYGSSDDEKQWITSRLQSTATADDYTAKIDELSDKITQAKGEYDKLSDELDHLDGDRYDAVFNRMTQLGRDIEENKKRLGKYQDELKPAKLRDKKNEYMQLRYNEDFAENSYSREKEQERSDWDNRKYMTADEQAVYNYLYNTQGEEKAEDFFKSMESELNKRMTVSESQKAADFAEAEPVLSSVVSIGQNLVSGAGAVEDIGRAITGQPVDQNSALHIPSHLATAQRQAVAGNIDNDLGKWVYNTAMSAADSAANILVAKGAGSVAGALGVSASAAERITLLSSDILMGSQVATQTVIQAKDKGLTDSQAVAQGVIHGLIEGVTEHFSVENILADPRNFRQTLLKSFVAEGSEEVAANWLDRIADSIIEGDEYEKRRKYEEYLKQGMSDTEALTNIVIEYLGEDADSFLAGGVSGVAMSAASHGYNGVAYDINQAREKIGNHMANTAVGKAVIQGDNAENEINDLINDGKNLDKGSAGYKLAQKLEEKQGHGKKLSASEIGKLYGYVKESKLKFVTANMSEEEQATVINAAEKLSNGQALSDEEVKAINDSPNAAQAIAILTGAEENETNSLVERQSESTAEYKTSSSGKTEADGKEFTGTLEIKSIDRQTGDVTYNLIDTDGTTEERSVLDLQFDSDETTQLHKKATAFSNINEANAFVDSHEKGQDVDEYTREWDLYSNYGRHSLSLNEQGRMDNGYVLSDEQKMTAYSYGLENYKSVAQRRKIASEALRASASFGYEQGTFNSTVSPKKRLNKEQKNVISALKIVSGAGINVEVFESKADKSGAFIGENGSFDVSTKTLRVDINAGYNTVKESLASAFKYGMLNTAAHELTHVAKHSGSWDELRNAVINVMEMGGEDFAKLTDSKLTQLQKSGKYQDYTSDELDELAEEEAICESCETMLQDGSLFEELVRENPKQANKLLEALKKVLDSVRNFFKRNGKYARTEQGKALLRALDKTESDLQAIWNNAVKEGIQAVNAGVESKGEIKEQARKKPKYEKQGGEWSDALTGAEWAKYNNAITSGVDAGLRISDNSILVECEENNIYQYKFVIYDNTFEDNPITSIYAIGNIDYNVTNANKLAQIIYEMENRGYGQKVFDKGLRRYAKGYKILLGKYNRKSNRYNQYGQSVATVRTNIKNQSNGTATYTTAGQIKFSDRIAQSDTDYLSAVERGDMETAQRMVDEAAERAFAASKVVDKDGKLLVVYHQTDADFTVFDTENKGAGRYDDETPAGIFLKPTNADIGLQGQKQMALYADIKNPLSVNSREGLVRHYSKNINGYTEAKQTIKDIDEAYGKKFKEEEKRENVEYQKLWEAWRNGKISKEEYRERASRDKLQEILDEWENKTNEARENVKDLITNYFKNSAFDGIILEHDSGSFGRSVKTYIAFNTEQIKSADPVTYDDDGKVIPLSERFKTDKADIRYQDRLSDDDIRDHVHRHFGHTYSWNETEYITTDGHRLDFSGRHEGAPGGHRYVDHRDVWDGYPEELQDQLDGSEAMYDFISRGNIRVMPEIGAIHLTVEPTQAQKNRLRDFISRERGEVTLDITDEKGNTLISVEYPKGTSSGKVLNDISDYFENGTEPTVSNLGKFRYQDRGDFSNHVLFDTHTKFSLREEAPPQNTVKGYKVFRIKDGKLYPPMVANPGGADTPVGVWLNADIGERAPNSKTGRAQVKGKGGMSLAFRPGWHLGDLPRAAQFDRKNPETGVKELFPSDFVWAECECAADIDYQDEAMSYGYTENGKFRHSYAGLPRIPENGYYKYRTNPRPDTVPWIITGAMKVNRILSDSEVADILKRAGVKPPERQGGNKTLAELGIIDTGVKSQDRYDEYDEEQALWDNFSLEDEESFFDTFDYEDAEQLIEIDPEDAAAILQTSYENTVNKVIKGYSWCKLREVDYDDILKRLAKGYDIPVGNGFEARDELKQAIERFVDTVEQTDADTELEIKRLATALNDIFDNYISSNRRSSKADYNSLAAQMAYDAVTAIIDAKAEIAAAYVEQGSAETIAELRRANDNLHKEYLAKMEAEKKKYERSIKKLNKGNDAKVARIQEYWAEFERKLREEKENVLKRNAESSSNRSIIANALPSLAKNEGELKRADTYRSYVKKLDSLDASIKSITRQIKELRFTKGYDKAKLKELENRKATLEKQLDRKEKALVNGFESTKPIQDLMNRAKRDAVNKAKAAKDKRIRQLREDGKERLRRQHEADMASKQEHLKKVREARDKKLIAAKEKRENDLRTLRDNRDKNVYIGKIKKLAKEFQQMALRPNDKSYVIPEFLRSGFYEAAQLITDAIKLSDNTKVGQGLGKISRMIGELAEDDLYKFEFDADFRKQVDAFAKAIEGKKIDRNLTLREAEDIYRLLKSIKDSIRDANKLLGKEEGHTVHEAGLRVIDDQNSIDRTFFNKHLNGIKNFFMTPERMSNMLNGYNPKAALVELFNDIKSGQRKKNRFFMEANKSFTQYRSEHVQELDDTVHNVREIVWHDNTGGKHTTRMTGMQAMQIVMTWNREAADNNLAHLTKGGITLANPELLAKGKIGKAYEKSFKVYGLNQSFIGEIQESLTEFERGYIKLAEDLFNKKSTDAINEVSLVLKHREIAKSKYYIPISVDSNEVVKDIDGIKFDASIEGMGMLKSITPKSDKSVLIVGLDNVITKHIDNVSKYYGLAIPIRNLNKVLNVSDTVRDEDGTVETRDTVKSSLQKNWGKLGEGVYTQLLTDLQTSRSAKGGVFEQNANKLIRTIRSNFVTSTLNANKSVVLKQAASYSAAGVYLNHTALVKGLGMFNKDYVGKGRYKKLLDEIDSHTAQHYIRRAGLSSNEISDIQSNWFSHFLSNNAAGRKISSSKLAQKLPKGVNPNNWIQEMDCMTTAALWCACKQQLNAEYHKAGKQLETKAYWQELTDLYDKVIEDTQPMYDPMHRPETLKLSNELIKSVFMFKTQPLQNAGIIYDAVGRLAQNKSDKAARRQLRKAVVSQVESLMTFALMSLAVAFLLHNLRRYKDEDDELTVQSVLGTVFSDIGQNGAGLLLPFGGSELVKGIFGNGDIVSDNVLEPITQLFDSGNELVQTVGKEFENNDLGLGVNSDNILKAIDDFVITAGQGIFGLPVKNVKKNLNSYIEWAKDIADGNGLFDSKMEDKSKKQTAHLYAKAYESGNTSEADRILTDYYNTELEKAKADGKTKNPENKASASTRDMLVDTYKTEYQKAFLKNDADQMRRIEKILYSANKYMKWRSGNNPITLNTGTASEPGKLKEWRMNAKNDIQSKNK